MHRFTLDWIYRGTMDGLPEDTGRRLYKTYPEMLDADWGKRTIAALAEAAEAVVAANKKNLSPKTPPADDDALLQGRRRPGKRHLEAPAD